MNDTPRARNDRRSSGTALRRAERAGWVRGLVLCTALAAVGCAGATADRPPTPAAGAGPSDPIASGGSTSQPRAGATQPARLEPRVGATVDGWIQPGETVRHPIALEKGEYLEAHLNLHPDEAEIRLEAPGTGSAAPEEIGWGEYSAEPLGQSLWGLASEAADHFLVIRRRGEQAGTEYRFTVLSLHPAGPREHARQAGQEAWEEAYEHWRQERFGEALRFFELALDHWTRAGYLRGEAAGHGRIGRILRKLHRPEEAVTHFERAIELWGDADDPRGVASNLTHLAGTEEERHRWEQGLDAANRVIAMSHLNVDATTIGFGWNLRCSIYESMGRIEDALEACSEAVEYWDGLSGSRGPGAVNPLVNLGLIHRRTGELARAESYYDQIVEILEEHPDPERRATIHVNVGTLLDSRGDFQGALLEYQRALDIHETRDDLAEIANQYYNIGTIHQRLGNLETTLSYYRRARALQESLEGETDNLIYTLLGIGWAQVLQGRPEMAREPMERGLELSRASGFKFLTVLSLRRMAHLEIADGRPAAAIPLIEEGLTHSREIRTRWQESLLLSHLATAHLQLGRPGEALEALQAAVSVNEDLSYHRELASNHHQIARIHRMEGDLARARQHIERAVEVADVARQRVGAREIRSLVAATYQEYHDFHVDLLMEQHARSPNEGHAAEALMAAERARSQNLLEVLSEADLDLLREAPADLVAEREEIRRRLAVVEARRTALFEDEPSADSIELFRVKRDLDSLLTRLAHVEQQIRAADPLYGALTRPESVTVAEIQRDLLDPETALLEFRLAGERSYLFAVTSDRFETFELPGREVLEEDARCVHWLVTAYGEPEELAGDEAERCLGPAMEALEALDARNPFEARIERRRLLDATFRKRASALSRQLLGPALQSGLLKDRRLAVVADGALEYVPFAALPQPGTDRLLIEDHELAFLPSASVLAFQRRQAPERHHQKLLAILADPVYGPADPRIDAEATRGERKPNRRTYPRLNFSDDEAAAIAALAPAEQVDVLLGAEADRKAVVGAGLAPYRYVHFATHGVIDDRYPALSGLILTQVDATGTPLPDGEGSLRLHDIYDMRLDAELVVLSACETALGREIRGEGLVSLARGFMHAGAERVVASLWRVQDVATAPLMEHLYRGLLDEGRNPADALRQAQLTMLSASDGRLSPPYYWAGFELQGDWR